VAIVETMTTYRSLQRGARVFAVAALTAFLAACGGGHNIQQAGDARPHPNVARAFTFPIQGIDVARYQGNIDWHTLKASGIRFAYIKMSEGGDYIDPMFQAHWRGATAARMQRGFYHFVYWCRPVHEQVAWIKANAPRDPDQLPPVLDLEWNTHSKTCPIKLSREQALPMISAMLQALREVSGKKPAIYTDITFHADVLEGQFNDHHYWLRSVANEPHVRYNNRKWTFWQFTATGRLPGINTYVDRNAFYSHESDWDRFAAGY
jgi:lysozyme